MLRPVCDIAVLEAPQVLKLPSPAVQDRKQSRISGLADSEEQWISDSLIS